MLSDVRETPASTPYGKPSAPLKQGKIVATEVVLLARHGRAHTIPPSQPFDAILRELLGEAAADLGFKCHRSGTVITIEGPRFSTRAESIMFRSWGADIINMSVVSF